jgi:hypothetical protein
LSVSLWFLSLVCLSLVFVLSFVLSLPCLCLIFVFVFVLLPCLAVVFQGPAEGKPLGKSKQPLWMQQWKAQRLREQFDQGTIQTNKVVVPL